MEYLPRFDELKHLVVNRMARAVINAKKQGGLTMQKLCLTILTIFLLTTLAYADSGIISVKSSHDVKTTADRLESMLKQKGMKVFIRINHAQGAQKIGKDLRPTELIIFGNPKVGTPLMQCAQSVAIDLPQKALIWQDPQGQVWLSYNDPNYLVERHQIAGCGEVIKKVKGALAKFAKAATMP
ncbi:putative inner membrane or exported protein [Olavius sp. associated proteobacterium Delta 1]|nr:putative inner membrane or exported protein [Olavius sp. associated proteobacterium Delta 1]